MWGLLLKSQSRVSVTESNRGSGDDVDDDDNEKYFSHCFSSPPEIVIFFQVKFTIYLIIARQNWLFLLPLSQFPCNIVNVPVVICSNTVLCA